LKGVVECQLHDVIYTSTPSRTNSPIGPLEREIQASGLGHSGQPLQEMFIEKTRVWRSPFSAGVKMIFLETANQMLYLAAEVQCHNNEAIMQFNIYLKQLNLFKG